MLLGPPGPEYTGWNPVKASVYKLQIPMGSSGHVLILQQPQIKLSTQVLLLCQLAACLPGVVSPFLRLLLCPPSKEADFKFHPGSQPDAADCKPTVTPRLAGRASSLALVATGCQSPVRSAPGGLPEGRGALLLQA